MTKSHDQRKGQWIFNKLRALDFSKETEEALFVAKLYEMTNDEFDKMMEEYEK